MKIYSIIPARGGSKRVPGKNIMLLKGHPLIAYSIRASLKSKLIQRTIVSTDTREIAIHAEKYGGEVPFLRPEEISKDKSTDYEFMNHAIQWFSEKESMIPDYLILLRPTTPIRDPKIIDDAISTFQRNREATALRSVHEMSETAYKCFEIENNLLKTLCSGVFELDEANATSQEFPRTYAANGYVDIIKPSFVLENEKLFGNKVLAYITDLTYEVDTTADFELLEMTVNNKEEELKMLFNN